jgi:hypothetical protein
MKAKAAAIPKQSTSRLVPNIAGPVIVPNHPPLGAGAHTYQYTNGAAPTQTPAAGNITQASGSLFIRFNRYTLEGTDITPAMSALQSGDKITIGPQTGTILNAPLRNGDVWALQMVSFPSLPDGTYQVSSSLGAAPGVLAPECSVNPQASGQQNLGATLDCTTGTWKGTQPIAYTYQWQRNGVDIAAAVSASYTLVPSDLGTTLVCRVTGTNGAGATASFSNRIGVP